MLLASAGAFVTSVLFAFEPVGKAAAEELGDSIFATGATSALAGRAASVLITAITVLIAMLSPMFPISFSITPAFSAFTSNVALSLSNSANGASISTHSPSFTNQLAIVTSLTDSPGAGTFISIAIDISADLPSKVRQRIRFVKVGIKKPGVLPHYLVPKFTKNRYSH